MLRSIEHLRQLHDSSNSSSSANEQQQRPFRLVLVAYSMGGVVARDVVRRLAAIPSFGRLCRTIQ